MEPKRRCSDPDDFRIISENADQMAGQQCTGDRQNEQNHGGDLHTEPESLPDTAIFFSAVVKPADRLESLPEPDQSRTGKHGNPAHNGHGGNRGIPIGIRGNIQRHGSDTAKSLPEKRRQPAAQDLPQPFFSEPDVTEPDGDAPRDADAGQQQNKTDELAEYRGNGGSRDPHVKDKDKKRVQRDIEDRPDGNPDHGIKSISLKTDLVIQYKLCSHVGGANQYDPKVLLRVRQNRFRRTKYNAERF